MSLRHASATALIALLLFAGCSDGTDPPEPLPTRTPSEAADPPSSTPPTAVSLTDAPEGETAKQFIRRWYALANHMLTTGDAEGFLAVAGPDCDSCHGYAEQVQSIYANGGYIRGGVETITNLKKESRTQWVVTVASPPTEYTESADGPVQRFPGGESISRLIIAKVHGKWIVGATEGLAR